MAPYPLTNYNNYYSYNACATTKNKHCSRNDKYSGEKWLTNMLTLILPTNSFQRTTVIQMSIFTQDEILKMQDKVQINPSLLVYGPVSRTRGI